MSVVRGQALVMQSFLGYFDTVLPVDTHMHRLMLILKGGLISHVWRIQSMVRCVSMAPSIQSEQVAELGFEPREA